MSAGDAFNDEMGPLRRRDIDDPEFSELVKAIRAAFLRGPDRALEASHLAAIASEAKGIPPAPMERKNRLGLLSRLVIVAAVLGLLSGGLALAGVDLPVLGDENGAESSAGPSADRLPGSAGDNAGSVIEAIETNLPLLREGEISGCEFGAMVSATARGTKPDETHCSHGSGETPERVLATIETNLPLLREGKISGCEFGAMVSAAARGTDPDPSHCKEREETTTRAGGSVRGRARAEEAKAAGQAKGEAASEGKANPGGKGEEASAGGQAKAEEAKAAGQAQAEEAKAGGQPRGEEASGGEASAGGNKD